MTEKTEKIIKAIVVGIVIAILFNFYCYMLVTLGSCHKGKYSNLSELLPIANGVHLVVKDYDDISLQQVYQGETMEVEVLLLSQNTCDPYLSDPNWKPAIWIIKDLDYYESEAEVTGIVKIIPPEWAKYKINLYRIVIKLNLKDTSKLGEHLLYVISNETMPAVIRYDVIKSSKNVEMELETTEELQKLKEHENKIILAEPNGLIFIPIKLPLELYEQNLNGTYTVYEDDKIMVFSIYMEDILTVADVTGY